jgi:SAM-dependent methyltransferase
VQQPDATGERTVPGVAHENYWFRRHEAAYAWAAERLRPGLVVLDCGLGEGYGAAALARTGALVVGLDCEPMTASHAAGRYGLPVVLGNAVDLPLPSAGLDVLVSLQVVEHLWDQPLSVREAARVLRPGGELLLSTPNRATFPPGNPWHTRELDAADLRALLGTSFADVRLLGVHHGPRLRRIDGQLGGLVAAQLATEPARWSTAVRDAVAGVTAGDFEVTERVEDALDLVAVARTVRPKA